MHTPLSLDAPTAPRRVFCAGLPFLIIDGRRIWSEPPPASIQFDLIAYDGNPLAADRSPDSDRSCLRASRRS